ncbi:MAG: haloalkane dehalogenase [Frankiaceae bacterium]|nr:haloalkane dehalogenase [Frankiaceae bacterium]
MELLRTPDERFLGLPDWDLAPEYVDLTGGIRVASVSAGPADGPVVLLLHGEPSWSYLYRFMLPVLASAGLRAVAVDLVGFGRSDKPAQVADHSYAAQVAWTAEAVLDRLGLEDITLVCQDWGGLIGLRVLAEAPTRFARVVAANTGLPDGTVRLPDVWWRFHDFVQRTEDLPVGFLVDGATLRALADEERAAYDAPYPSPSYKAGPRAMPGLIPQALDAPGAAENQAAWRVLEKWDKPFLTAFSDSDPITRGAERLFQKRVPGAGGLRHPTITGAGHFLQEDAGPELAQVVVDLIAST